MSVFSAFISGHPLKIRLFQTWLLNMFEYVSFPALMAESYVFPDMTVAPDPLFYFSGCDILFFRMWRLNKTFKCFFLDLTVELYLQLNLNLFFMAVVINYEEFPAVIIDQKPTIINQDMKSDFLHMKWNYWYNIYLSPFCFMLCMNEMWSQ